MMRSLSETSYDEQGLNASTQEMQKGKPDLTRDVAAGKKTCGARVKYVHVKMWVFFTPVQRALLAALHHTSPK